jgi:GNAT superfamily N-acetyltransferase
VGHVDANLPFLDGPVIGFISDVYVEDAHRKQGRATRLYAALCQWFRSRRVSSIQLHAAALNPESHAFWSRLGFHDYLVRMWADVPEE